MGNDDGKHRKPVDCAICKGTGKILISKNGDKEQKKRPCSRCNGTGKIT